jgi:nucleoside-diphosphate-sugar epimerase
VVNGYLALALNIDKTKGEAYNFGSKETLTVLGLIKIIEKTLKIKIKCKILNITKNEIPYQSLNYDKIKKTLGWRPKHTIDKTITNIYSSYIKIIL